MTGIDPKVLADYVATANNPEYKGDYDIINSKFPELKDYDSKLLADYVATANNPEYGGDYATINSKFPEFFQDAPQQTGLKKIRKKLKCKLREKKYRLSLIPKAQITLVISLVNLALLMTLLVLQIM